MLYDDRIDICERIYVNKSSELKECAICHYCFFLIKALNFNQTSAIYAITF